LSVSLHITAGGECSLGGQLLHPAHDPLASASAEVFCQLERTEPDDTVVIAGAGLGWHARALLDLADPPRLIIYDPNPQAFDLINRFGPELNGAAIARSELELSSLLAERVVYQLSGWVSVYSPPAYRQSLPQLAEQARRLVDEAILRGKVDRTTRGEKKKLWLENLVNNFKQLTELPDLALLSGVMKGMPALVVGAGPSLDQDLELLAPAKERGLILAAASVLGPMQRINETPHLALALEGADESRQFINLGAASCLLGAASTGHPNHFRRWPGPKALFHLFPWIADLGGLGSHIPTGGHATSASFSLAVLWGCSPIILVGQDLAYTGGRMHATARPGGEDYDSPKTVTVCAKDGGTTNTSVAMHSYISWYRDAAGYLGTLKTPPPPDQCNLGRRQAGRI
jgi:hypothetical protein